MVSYVRESVAMTITVVAGVLGATATTVFNWLGWQNPIPPQFVWLACTLVMFGAQAWMYRSLYQRHSALLEAAQSDTHLPASQRERLHRVKELAGRINAGLHGFSYASRDAVDTWRDELYREGGALHEHPSVASMVFYYTGSLSTHFSAMDNVATEEQKREILQGAWNSMDAIYNELIRTCNDLLDRYPPRSVSN